MNNQSKKALSYFVVLLLLGFVSCKHTELDVSKYPEVCFDNQILPVFKASCGMSGCHNSTSAEAGYILTDYQNILNGVIPYKPFESEVYTILSSNWVHPMPPENPLPQEIRTLIRLWIEQGAMETSCPDTSNVLLRSQHGSSVAHHPGENCMLCHAPSGDAAGWFSLAGTVYDSSLQTIYPNATVKLYTEASGQGTLVETLETDADGMFYSTDEIDFLSGLYPVVEGTNGETMYMSQPVFTGQCYSCHGQDQSRIYIQGSDFPIPSDSICFQTEVLPILMSSCAMSQCHDAYSAQDDIILNSYFNVMYSDDNDLVVPGFPTQSELYEVLIEDDPEKRMPPSPNNALAQEQIDIIYNWIAEGALDRDCTEGPCDTVNVTFSGTIWPLVQNNCTGCHSGGTPAGNILLTDYASVKNIADNNMLLSVLHGSPQMPPYPSSPLSDCNIRQFEIWMNNGTLNN